MIYHSPESFYLSTYFLSFTYIPFYLAPYIYILHLSFFYLFFNLFSSFILSHFLSFTWILFYLSSQFFFIFLLNFFYLPPYFFNLSPETRKSKSPSAAAVHCCRHSTKIKMLMLLISLLMFLMILLEKVIPAASGLGSNICQCKAWWRLRDARRSCPTIGKVARLKKKFLNWGEVVKLEDRLRDFRRGCVTLGKVMWWKERMEFFRSST